MAVFYRIVRAHRAAAALRGDEARRHGGRWNSRGQAAVYLAESRALAALEIVVHTPPEMLATEWTLLEVEIANADCETLPCHKLPPDWQDYPPSLSARALGDCWLRATRHLALRLPSAIIPEEHNLLVNPRHPAAAGLRIRACRAFDFDGRLGRK